MNEDSRCKEARAKTIPCPVCLGFDPEFGNPQWAQLRIHSEVQDTECSGWQRLNELIDQAARDGRNEFSPGLEMTPEQWAQIMMLPASIARLKSVKRFVLDNSKLVRIPPEIGEMSSLEIFLPYASYGLHWFVCDASLVNVTPIQLWISLRVGTDVIPLLVHACSSRCILDLPTPPEGYVQFPHSGGLDLVQPDDVPQEDQSQ